ncbi:MAG: type III-A CRISPR-associated protein Csm2 [Lachnospiraceae bacterium]|jgi:CRISPR-associated protein Csm2|nr:type III-A CRISPR-associated protein Csm2 [Lachnospiraceae bacterium]
MQVNEQNYVDMAEKVICSLKNKKNKQGRAIPMVTTSKLRNLLAMTIDIYNETMDKKEEKLDPDICSRIEYLRVRFLYEAGREPAVRNFVDEAGIINLLKHINGSKKNYVLFNRYMEALVAFHKYHGGKDN